MVTVELAQRLSGLPPYLFAEIDKVKDEMRRKGVDLISLGIGDPDIPTPPHIVKALQAAAEKASNHQYAPYEGTQAFREAVAQWYQRRFGVTLDPATEVMSLIGSKEGIGHLPLAFINPGDVVLVPDPGYPVYHAGTLFAGGESVMMPLHASNGFLPDLKTIAPEQARRAKIMFINYPNNPTAAVAPKAFFEEVVEFAHRYNIIVCHDAAYSEVAFDGYRPLSFLEVDGACEVGIEMHSLSKTYNMTGWRIGFAVGNARILAGLATIKTNLDSGVFMAVQDAAIAALTGPDDCVEEMRGIYQRRQHIAVAGLKEIGLSAERPRATFYLWIPVAPKYTSSSELTTRMIREAGVVPTPGIGFGAYGEGFIRLSLTVDDERIREAIERLKKVGL
ncbi:MAG TPA: LL-diaminopimelate aminotransferase [Candidatus Tectomicrobia bacterium]|nr:LL-diaminopimelate aminotransferase [Candidatus Tectomicrobia bacterium]